MLMVIFGAGASSDSVKPSNRARRNDDPLRPPLADALFDLRENFTRVVATYPDFAVLVDRLRGAVARQTPVEAELERIKQEARVFSWYHRALAATQFYLREILWECGSDWIKGGAGVTNYASLLDHLRRWQVRQVPSEDVLLVTFNYDTMLDDACRAIGMNLDSVAEYISQSPFKLLKPHGSVNWFIKTRLDAGRPGYQFAARQLIEHAPVPTTGEYLVRNTQEPDLTIREGEGRRIKRALMPAIAIPVQNKDSSSFAFPPSHAELLTSSIERVTHLLVIGWRGTEEHFLELWKPKRARLKRVVVVAESEESARATMQRLADADLFHDVTGRIPRGGGFSGLSDPDELAAMIGR